MGVTLGVAKKFKVLESNELKAFNGLFGRPHPTNEIEGLQRCKPFLFLVGLRWGYILRIFSARGNGLDVTI